jgi:hypothetical protein
MRHKCTKGGKSLGCEAAAGIMVHHSCIMLLLLVSTAGQCRVHMAIHPLHVGQLECHTAKRKAAAASSIQAGLVNKQAASQAQFGDG